MYQGCSIADRLIEYSRTFIEITQSSTANIISCILWILRTAMSTKLGSTARPYATIQALINRSNGSCRPSYQIMDHRRISPRRWTRLGVTGADKRYVGLADRNSRRLHLRLSVPPIAITCYATMGYARRMGGPSKVYNPRQPRFLPANLCVCK